MWLLIAEAVLAGAMLVFIVWWTMSSRRKTQDQVTDDKSADAKAIDAVVTHNAQAKATELPASEAQGLPRPGAQDPRQG